LIGARRPDQLQANLVALDMILTDAQMAQLNEVSKPVLNFPADINNHVAPMVGFPGATIDGRLCPRHPCWRRAQIATELHEAELPAEIGAVS
jgi:hypothetical protein